MRNVRRVVLGALVLAVLACASGAALGWSQGWRVYAVRTGSMMPTVGIGDLVVDAPAGRGLPRPGQVVTVRTSQGLVSHRVHTVDPSSATPVFTTKGDANPAPDSWQVPQHNLVGVVRYTVPRAGYLTVFLRQPTGVPSLMLAALAVALAWSLFFGSSRSDGLKESPAAA